MEKRERSGDGPAPKGEAAVHRPITPLPLSPYPLERRPHDPSPRFPPRTATGPYQHPQHAYYSVMIAVMREQSRSAATFPAPLGTWSCSLLRSSSL